MTGASASPSGSRASTEPSYTVSAASGFDPSRSQPEHEQAVEALREWAQVYHLDRAGGAMTRAADLIERLAADNRQLLEALEYAHSEGFEWPTDPCAGLLATGEQA